jgi:hypothetical protein
MNETKELAVVEPGAVSSYSVNEVRVQVTQIHKLMEEMMKDGTHYGNSFPGDTKKNLLKPGADKLMFMFRLRPDFEQDIKELPNGHREVLTRCKVYHIESGNKIAEGVGCASTMESKYRWRNADKKCPHCGKETIKKSKKENGGFYCFTKIGGCGANFEDGDPAIVNQVTGKVENPDIADCYNTVLKISKKRAYVDATITATAASDIFTQDVDDLPENENGNGNGNGHGNGDSLAGEALNGKSNGTNGKTRQETQPDQNQIIEGIGKMITALNPDKLPYFTDKEKELAKTKVEGAKSAGELKNLHDGIKADLEGREADYKPVPFDDKTPAMYTEKEPEFVDEIPD